MAFVSCITAVLLTIKIDFINNLHCTLHIPLAADMCSIASAMRHCRHNVLALQRLLYEPARLLSASEGPPLVAALAQQQAAESNSPSDGHHSSSPKRSSTPCASARSFCTFLRR